MEELVKVLAARKLPPVKILVAGSLTPPTSMTTQRLSLQAIIPCPHRKTRRETEWSLTMSPHLQHAILEFPLSKKVTRLMSVEFLRVEQEDLEDLEEREDPKETVKKFCQAE